MLDLSDKMSGRIKVTPLMDVQDCNRSSSLVKIGDKHVLFDCGLNLSSLEASSVVTSNNGHCQNDDRLLPDFTSFMGPQTVSTSIDCVIISHFHTDHSGALPYLTEILGYKGPIFLTQPTKTIAPFVWRECRKNLLGRNVFPDFLSPSKINDCLSKVTTVVYSQLIEVDNEISITVYPSNQHLGPDIFHLDVGSQSIIYTGGCNLKPYSVPMYPSLLRPPPSSHSKAKESLSIKHTFNPSSPSSDQQADLTIKMNGCMLSFKIGHSVSHRQLSPQQMQLVTSVFNNLKYMTLDKEEDFWKRISYEMTRFSPPLESSQKWKTLFYDDLASCSRKSENIKLDSLASQHKENQVTGAISNGTNGSAKKKRKNKKAISKNAVNWSNSSGDLIKFDTPEKDSTPSALDTPKKVTKKKNENKEMNSNSNLSQSPRPFTPDPTIVNDQSLLITMFAERLKKSQITSEFWTELSRDLQNKGKNARSSDYLEEYFKRLSNIQLEIMKSSSSADEAQLKWPHFDLLNDIDLSYFFQDKWDYRNAKKHYIVTSTTPNKSTKSKKQKKQSKLSASNSNHENHQEVNGYKNQPYERQNHQNNSNQLDHPSSEETEPQIFKYDTPPEDLADMLITITLFASRLKKTDISPEFWTLLYKDFENIGRPIYDNVNLEDHFRSLAETQLNVMKTADNIATAASQWPLFMMLHELPMDKFLIPTDKWSYRKLKPKFH